MYIERHADLNWAKLDVPKYMNKYDFPVIERQEIDVRKIFNIIPFNDTTRRNGYTHFYMYDYMFTRVWNQPDRYIKRLKEFQGALSPDFSLYTDYPAALQIFNTYRNRWLGAYWQSKGISVIPTICWAEENTFDFCFDGVEEGSVVSVSTVGVMKEKGRYPLFIKGFEEMMKRIEPSHILLYGQMNDNLEKYKDMITIYSPYYDCFREDIEGEDVAE